MKNTTPSYEQQQLDRLVKFMGENSPRPQQDFLATRQRLEEMLPAVYAEFDKNLEPLDLLGCIDYKFWVGRQFLDLWPAYWLMRLEHELAPEGTDHKISKDFLETRNFSLDRILLPDDLPKDRLRILNACQQTQELFWRQEDELMEFLEEAEEKALQLEELLHESPEDLEVEWLFGCGILWRPELQREENLEKLTKYGSLLTTLGRDELVEELMKEVETNIARQAPRAMFRHLQRLYTTYMEYLAECENLRSQFQGTRDTEDLLGTPYDEERQPLVLNINRLQTEQLTSMTMFLDEKLGELTKRIREEGQAEFS